MRLLALWEIVIVLLFFLHFMDQTISRENNCQMFDHKNNCQLQPNDWWPVKHFF